MTCEVSTLFINCFLDWNAVNDIFLRSVLNADVAESKSHLLVHNHALSVCAAIHNIDLCYDTDGSDTFGVELTRHLKTVRGGHICVSGHHAKNDCAGITYVPVSHCTCNFFDVVGLASDGDTGDSGQVDKCKIGTRVGVHLEYNWLVNNVFIVSANFVREPDDVVLNFLEVCEFSSRNFIRENCIWRCVSIYVVETKLKGTSRDYTITSWQEVKTDDRFQH